MDGIWLLTITSTICFMSLSFVTDVKGRYIYGFPCMMLSGMWLVLEVISVKRIVAFLILFAFHLLVYSLLCKKKLWGDGDSDVLLLYFLVFTAYQGLSVDFATFLLWELIGVVIALALSFFVGVIEAKIRGRKLSKRTVIAVVPGFSIVMVYMLCCIWIVR